MLLVRLYEVVAFTAKLLWLWNDIPIISKVLAFTVSEKTRVTLLASRLRSNEISAGSVVSGVNLATLRGSNEEILRMVLSSISAISSDVLEMYVLFISVARLFILLILSSSIFVICMTICGPLREIVSPLNKVYDRYGASGFRIVIAV